MWYFAQILGVLPAYVFGTITVLAPKYAKSGKAG